MRAAVHRIYGGPEVVRVEDVPTPVPGRGEMLVRVEAACVSAGDTRIRAARFPRGFGLAGRLVFGPLRPRAGARVLGSAFAGRIEQLGPEVTGWSEGDAIVAVRGMRMGAHAEFALVRMKGAIAPRPAGLAAEPAAALCFGALTAHHFLVSAGHLAASERLAVLGARGAVGSAAVCLAKALGAHVTALVRSERGLETAPLGADEVLAGDLLPLLARTQPFDFVLDTTGALSPREGCRALAPGGRLALVAADLPQTLAAPFVARRAQRRILVGTAPERPEALEALLALAAAGHLRPPIDRIYPLDQITEAHARAESPGKLGCVLVRCTPQAHPEEVRPPEALAATHGGP